MNNRDGDVLEAMVDKHGLGYVVNLLSTVAHEKAEHIRLHWQDERTASVWDKAADRLARMQAGFDRLNL